ncbi:MAG: TIGR00725 family protein, partial [Chloroflexi bacterium]|nr:TIGR00725 family protein [Chloroflexota bacterium]
MDSARRAIAVIGPGDASEQERAAAYAVGRLAAQRGADVFTGGLGGVMEAACRGASEAGGLTVGILPGTSVGEANPYVRVAVPTGMGEARNAILVRSSDCL